MISDASRRQNQASQPDLSTWLSANAGSGKTRVLTDRGARWLLAGADPQNILCLTYTKAAASEMQNRLFKTLGNWAMTPEDELRTSLKGLGENSTPDIDRARTLFARAIETPGGLRIQTIHSFCSSILRRFPLEAGVSPTFTEMDDSVSEALRREVLERLTVEEPHVIEAMLEFASTDRLLDVASAMLGSTASFDARTEAKIAEASGTSVSESAVTIEADTFLGGEMALLERLAEVLATGSDANQKQAERLTHILARGLSFETLPNLEGIVLFGATAAAPFGSKAGRYPTKALRTALGDTCDPLDALMDRVADARQRRLALDVFRKSIALHQFAGAFLPAYSREKTRRGVLDYDDLIQKTLQLLTKTKDATWVLYKLDGDIDHILIDEAQDTSPAQWQVIGALAEDIAAGASDRERSIFVVGDKKQSIYSFQGADPREFDRMQAHFADRLREGSGLQSLELEYSFRSSSAVLSVVDNTFADVPSFTEQAVTRHRAFHTDKPGRVDVWPPLLGGEKRPDDPWFAPLDTVSEEHPARKLANAVADEIKRLIDDERLPIDGGGWRKISPGDIMLLLQARSGYNELFYALIAACKDRGIDVAGPDRLSLMNSLAVRDIISLLSFVALPEDDLSLATALRSPLLGWSESELYELAQGRTETYLWTTLRNRADTYPRTLAILNDLRRNGDFLRPYEMIERILTRHDGRRRLLARLGDEAEDGIDELLNQALAFEQKDVPNLTRFLSWIVSEDVEVKRQMDAAGDKVRVMTVHGAKGLEAPIVILPDATRPDRKRAPDLVISADGTALWPTARGDAPDTVLRALEDHDDKQGEEKLRLMYVAMTRAETWLIVCGSDKDAGTWHERIHNGAAKAGAADYSFDVGKGLRLEWGDWTGNADTDTTSLAHDIPQLPEWASSVVDPPKKQQQFVSPSDLGGAKAIAGAQAESQDALARGTALHRLLEVLPDIDSGQREAVGRKILAAEGMTDASLIDDALDVIGDPDLAAVLTGDVLREVEVAAPLGDGSRTILGAIDLLRVESDRVLVVDFKSNAVLPETPDQVPDGLLRQMGAYSHALAQVYPDHAIETAILWTSAPKLMVLPHEIVRNAFSQAAIS